MWSCFLLVFAYQMMLILVLGHILVLCKLMSRLIDVLTFVVPDFIKSLILVRFGAVIVGGWALFLMLF